jgi:osmotically inducible protein OsmC
MPTSQATARWEGTLKDGRGTMKPAHASEVPFTLNTRFAGEKGSNPEEVVGAALAGCFSMALSASLSKEGLAPKTIDTNATVQLDKDGDGFKISSIALRTQVSVTGLSATQLETIAQETKRNCPVSKALAGTQITLTVALI